MKMPQRVGGGRERVENGQNNPADQVLLNLLQKTDQKIIVIF